MIHSLLGSRSLPGNRGGGGRGHADRGNIQDPGAEALLRHNLFAAQNWQKIEVLLHIHEQLWLLRHDAVRLAVELQLVPCRCNLVDRVNRVQDSVQAVSIFEKQRTLTPCRIGEGQ